MSRENLEEDDEERAGASAADAHGGKDDCIECFYSNSPRVREQYPRASLDRTPIHIGRAEDNDLVIDDEDASRRHATLEERDGAWFLIDCGSRNGTSINGNPVTGEVRLRHRDRVKVGSSVLQFLCTREMMAGYEEQLLQMGDLDITGVVSRSVLIESLDREIRRVRRQGKGLWVVLIQVKDFQRYGRSRYEREMPDIVLQRVAKVLFARAPDDAVLGRYGVDIFAIVLPEPPIEGAEEVADATAQRARERGVIIEPGAPMEAALRATEARLEECDGSAQALLQRTLRALQDGALKA